MQKAFDKIQNPFMIKTLQKVGIEGIYLNIIKAIRNKHTENILLNVEKLKVFLLRLGIRQRCSLSPLLFNSFVNPSHGNQRRKRNKRNQIWKKEVKLSLFADDMKPHRENPQEATRKLLELID